MKVALVVLSLAAAATACCNPQHIELGVAKSAPSKFEVKATGIPLHDEYASIISKTPIVTVDDVLSTPTFVLIPSGESGKYAHFYVEKGLKALTADADPALKPVVDFINTPAEKKAIAFKPASVAEPALLKLSVTDGHVPSDRKVGDVFKSLSVVSQLPFVIIDEASALKKLSLEHDPIAKLSLAPGSIKADTSCCG